MRDIDQMAHIINEEMRLIENDLTVLNKYYLELQS